jgi:flagellar assembly factor FliW
VAYSDFTLKKVVQEFSLTLSENENLFADCLSVEPSAFLIETLNENVPLALSISTEKARSELIIINLFIELRKKYDHKISLFSGVKFDVDASKNLNGFCDFIISSSPEQLFITAPIIAVVEAKNENIISGLGQCIAEMIAAQQFNAEEKQEIKTIYGIVTTGNAWKFLKLVERNVFIDMKEYHIDNTAKILGILAAMIEQKA